MRLLGFMLDTFKKNKKAVEGACDVGKVSARRLPTAICLVSEVFAGDDVAGRKAEGHGSRMPRCDNVLNENMAVPSFDGRETILRSTAQLHASEAELMH